MEIQRFYSRRSSDCFRRVYFKSEGSGRPSPFQLLPNPFRLPHGVPPLQSEIVLGTPGQALPVPTSHRQTSSQQFRSTLFVNSEAMAVPANSLRHIWRTVKALRESAVQQILRTFWRAQPIAEQPGAVSTGTPSLLRKVRASAAQKSDGSSESCSVRPAARKHTGRCPEAS